MMFFIYLGDLARHQKVGSTGICRWFEIEGLRIASLGRSLEYELLALQRKQEAINSELVSVKASKDQEVEALKKRITDLEKTAERVSFLQHDNELLKKDKEKLQADQLTLSEDLKSEKVKRDVVEKERLELQDEISKLKNEALDQHIAGFEKAIDQARMLCPKVDFTALGPFRVYKDGRFVEEDEMSTPDSVELGNEEVNPGTPAVALEHVEEPVVNVEYIENPATSV